MRKAGAENHSSTWPMWVAKTTFFPHSTKSGWGVHWVLAFQRRSEMFAASNCFLCYKKQCGLSLRISVLSLSVGEGEGKEEVLLFLRKACWPFYFLWSNKSAISSVQLISRVWLFATPWIEACQASLSITNSSEFTQTHVHQTEMPQKKKITGQYH